jgi:hypothetical protein
MRCCGFAMRIERIAPAKRPDLLLVVMGIALLVATFAPRLWLLRIRSFDPDEFEHLHASWLLSKGFLPYRDYFEHHTPALYFFLAPVFAFFDVETSFAEAKAMMIFSRQLMCVLTGLALLLVLGLGWRWRDWRVGLAGAVFTSGTITFLKKTLEVRPDVLCAVFWMACLLLLLRAVTQTDAGTRRARGFFFGSGVLLGLTVLTTQKMLFTVPGFALTMVWYAVDRRSHGTVKMRCQNVLWQLAGFALPLAVTLGYFAGRDGLYEFVEFNLLLNLRVANHFPPYGTIRTVLSQNPVILGLGMIGCARVAIGMFKEAAFRRGDFVLVINTLGLIFGLFLLPQPYRQYFLTFLPLLGLLGATGLVDMVDWLLALRRRRPSWLRPSRVVTIAGTFAVVTTVGLWWSLTSPDYAVDLCVEVLFAVCALALAMIPLSFGRGGSALAIVLLLWSIYPLNQIHAAFEWTNRRQLAILRYVLENTTPEETVMDGWSGIGVFRPHAWFYWFPHGDINPLFTPEQRRGLLEDLRSGKIAPKLVNLDASVQSILPEVTEFFTKNYEPVGLLSIRKRNRWLDLAILPSELQPHSSPVSAPLPELEGKLSSH